MNNPEYHVCPTCDYMWKHGEHGEHSCVEYMSRKLQEMTESMKNDKSGRGLKDHEIRGLVDKITLSLNIMCNMPSCTRDVVANAVRIFLNDNDLRIDKNEKEI